MHQKLCLWGRSLLSPATRGVLCGCGGGNAAAVCPARVDWTDGGVRLSVAVGRTGLCMPCCPMGASSGCWGGAPQGWEAGGAAANASLAGPFLGFSTSAATGAAAAQGALRLERANTGMLHARSSKSRGTSRRSLPLHVDTLPPVSYISHGIAYACRLPCAALCVRGSMPGATCMHACTERHAVAPRHGMREAAPLGLCERALAQFEAHKR